MRRVSYKIRNGDGSQSSFNANYNLYPGYLGFVLGFFACLGQSFLTQLWGILLALYWAYQVKLANAFVGRFQCNVLCTCAVNPLNYDHG